MSVSEFSDKRPQFKCNWSDFNPGQTECDAWGVYVLREVGEATLFYLCAKHLSMISEALLEYQNEKLQHQT